MPEIERPGGPEDVRAGHALRGPVGDDERDREDDREDHERLDVGGGDRSSRPVTSRRPPSAADAAARARARTRTDRVGERVVRALGAAQVHEPEREDHDELRQRQAVADGEALVHGAAHEVRRVAREQDEADVPREEEDRRRKDEPPPRDTSSRNSGERSTASQSTREPGAVISSPSRSIVPFRPPHLPDRKPRHASKRRSYSGILERPRRPARPLLKIAFCAV